MVAPLDWIRNPLFSWRFLHPAWAFLAVLAGCGESAPEPSAVGPRPATVFLLDAEVPGVARKAPEASAAIPRLTLLLADLPPARELPDGGLLVPLPFALAVAGPEAAPRLEDASGQPLGEPGELRVLPAHRTLALAEVTELAHLEKRPDGSGFLRVLVAEPTTLTLPVFRVGVAEKVTLEVELVLTALGTNLEENELPRVVLERDGQEVGALRWGSRRVGAQVLEGELPAAHGLEELTLRVERVAREHRQVLLRTLVLEHEARGDLLHVPANLASRARRISLLPALPEPVQRWQPAAAGGLALLLAGTTAVVRPGADPFEVHSGDQLLARSRLRRGTGNRYGHEAVFESPKTEVRALRFTSAVRSNTPYFLLQPAALEGRLPAAVRGPTIASPAGPRHHVMVGNATHRCALLSVGESLTVPLELASGDRLELTAAVLDRGAAELGFGSLRFVLEWQGAAGQSVTLSAVPLATGAGFRSLSLALPDGCRGPGDLTLCTEALGEAQAGRLLTLALGEPRLVRPGQPAPPNVLVYLVDTLRADHLSCYGYERQTPAFDALAADGILFERAYAPASWTKPSVASVFCSLLPSFHGVGTETGLSGELRTLAERLHDARYETAAFVANPYVHLRGLNFEQGFSEFHAVSTGGRSPRAEDVHGPALHWLERHRDRPFFLYLHTIDPHETYDPPPDTAGTYRADYRGELTPANTFARVLRARDAWSGEDVQFLRDLYDEEILHADREFGRLVTSLKELGVYDNTVLVFLSDHGEEFHEHGGFGHGRQLWEELLHVPWILKPAGEGGPRGVRVKAAVPLLSLGPSLHALLGLAPFEMPVQGPSLAPWWQGEEHRDLDIVAEQMPEMRCFIRGPHKVIRFLQPGRDGRSLRRSLLFDLASDPHERQDLASSRADLLRTLERALDEKLAADRRLGVAAIRGNRDVDLSEAQEDLLRKLGYLGEQP